MATIVFSCFVFVHLVFVFASEKESIRVTQYGRIRGKVTSRYNGFEVEEFLGVPYAAPPVGDLRFQRPQDPPSWAPNILDTVSIGAACPTYTLEYIQVHKPDFSTMSENCLFLNIYVPITRTSNLPILLFIHGGDNADGMGAMFDGDLLAAHGEIIVITMNYRVGVLGFYANPDIGITGNNGLFDQVKAMKWIQENIKKFNGDPSRVTIHGHSAGAGDVGVHLLSELTRGLFRNAIIHSGSPLADWFMSKCVRTSRVASVSESCRQDHSKVDSGLKAKISQYLLNKSGSMDDFITSIEYGEDVFHVVVDGEYLTDSPDKLFQCQPPHADSVLFMMAKDEGFEPRVSRIEHYYKNRDVDEIVETYKHMFPEIFQDDLKKSFEDWKKHNISQYPHYLHTVADIQFFVPMLKLADFLSKWIKDIYVLSFEYVSEKINGPAWIGVQHGWDLFYLFGEPLVGHPGFTFTTRDINVSLEAMTVISDFVKKGELMYKDRQLETYNSTLRSYQKLDYKDNQMTIMEQTNFKETRIDFWYKYLFAYEYFDCNSSECKSCRIISLLFVCFLSLYIV